MFCPNCVKLAYLPIVKRCIKCQGTVDKNISVLCETCSVREKICASCLKRFYTGFDNPNYRHMLAGCKACGSK